MKKTFRVFKGFLPKLLIFTAVMVLFFVSMKVDIFGFNKKVPEADKLDKITLMTGKGDLTAVTDDEKAEVVRIHDMIISNLENRDSGLAEDRNFGIFDSMYGSYSDIDGYYLNLYFDYTYKSGSTLFRQYTLVFNESTMKNQDLPQYYILQLFNKPEVVKKSIVPSNFRSENIVYIDITPYDKSNSAVNTELTGKEAEGLYDAIARDIDDGNIRLIYSDKSFMTPSDVLYANGISVCYKPVYNDSLLRGISANDTMDYNNWFDVRITTECENTRDYLKGLGYIDESIGFVTEKDLYGNELVFPEEAFPGDN